MKATLTYEGKTVEVEISETEAQKIFNEPKKTGWERVKFDQTYYYISGGGLVAPEMEKWNKSDYLYYNNGNYFTDKNLANDQARAISLWLRIKRWTAEHCEPVDWRDPDSGKYLISYNNTKMKFAMMVCMFFEVRFRFILTPKSTPNSVSRSSRTSCCGTLPSVKIEWMGENNE